MTGSTTSCARNARETIVPNCAHESGFTRQEPTAQGGTEMDRFDSSERQSMLRGNEEPDLEILRRDFVGEPFDIVARRVDARVRIGEEEVDSIKFRIFDSSGCG